MSTHRIHDLAPLRAHIKSNANKARSLRQQARQESGPDRHYLKEKAKEDADETRAMLLALGYLKGRTISQMESGYSLPENLPSSSHILGYCAPAFNEGPDATEENAADWDEFKAALEADLKAWKTQLILSQQTRAAIRRKAAEAA